VILATLTPRPLTGSLSRFRYTLRHLRIRCSSIVLVQRNNKRMKECTLKTFTAPKTDYRHCKRTRETA